MFSNITKLSRIMVLVAALALALVFFFPIWSIDLWAPQYPEGLGLKIWLTKMTGDLDNINLLNHYIGMHPIKPDEIPELKFFVYIFSGLLAGMLLVAALGKRILLYGVTVLLLAFSTWALYDFYMWEYKYGHELDPNAAIKMEGESYQPPLIGTKYLMNIEASSWPSLGGYGHIVAVVLLIGSSFVEFKSSRRE